MADQRNMHKKLKQRHQSQNMDCVSALARQLHRSLTNGHHTVSTPRKAPNRDATADTKSISRITQPGRDTAPEPAFQR
jgi:hypothetical protein